MYLLNQKLRRRKKVRKRLIDSPIVCAGRILVWNLNTLLIDRFLLYCFELDSFLFGMIVFKIDIKATPCQYEDCCIF